MNRNNKSMLQKVAMCNSETVGAGPIANSYGINELTRDPSPMIDEYAREPYSEIHPEFTINNYGGASMDFEMYKDSGGGAAVLERPVTLPKTKEGDGGGGGGGVGGGGGDDGGGKNSGGGGAGDGGGSGGGDKRNITSDEKFTEIGGFAGKVLSKCMPKSELDKLEANPFGKLSYLGVIRSFIDQPDFPF